MTNRYRKSNRVFPMKVMLIAGTLETGFDHYGPFETSRAAWKFASEHLQLSRSVVQLAPIFIPGDGDE